MASTPKETVIASLGVYIKEAFDKKIDYFHRIHQEHTFHSLTAGSEATPAYRTGIYLSKVETIQPNQFTYQLLRCSTNFQSPTDHFRATDTSLVSLVNTYATQHYAGHAELNHVLAQVYRGKAKINSHSDKTKDMPDNGLLAFCTFYETPCENETKFTKLRFRSKVNKEERFDIVLHPHSLFLVPLEINRLYTHEIRPSPLTRLGYVVRASNTQAVFKEEQTFINDIALRAPNEEEVQELKALYKQENQTTAKIVYKDIYFSLNEGDYLKPNHQD